MSDRGFGVAIVELIPACDLVELIVLELEVES